MDTKLRFSLIEYLTLFFLASFCTYILVPEVHSWVLEHMLMVLDLR
jgi:hypothetical protein